jgi:hypothetical protein
VDGPAVSTATISADFDARRLTLGLALEMWGNRDDARPEAEPRRAASYAIGLIDAMARELAAIRERLLSETGAADGADVADAPRDGRCAS